MYFFRKLILWKLSQAILTVRSLTYNEHMSQSYAIDILLEPIFWIVDNFAKFLGKVNIYSELITSNIIHHFSNP